VDAVLTQHDARVERGDHAVARVGADAADVTRIRPSSPRAASILSSSACAITLRHVLAWQTTSTVLATRVGERAIVRATAADPRLQHLAELRTHGIDAADGIEPRRMVKSCGASSPALTK